MHKMNEKGKHYQSVILAPDYSSSGIWCECGMEISDPLETTNIPYKLIELVDGWNLLWEHMSIHSDDIRVDVIEKKIISIGRILADMVSEYVPCVLREESCNLNIIRK